MFSYSQIDMKNMTQPIQTRTQLARPVIDEKYQNREVFTLSVNKFYDYSDQVGLFEQDFEPYTYLTIDTRDKEKVPKTSEDDIPTLVIEFMLSEQFSERERTAYTFMTLIGDIGGFNGAIIIFPGLFMNWYSSKMFDAAIASEIPSKKKNKRARQ